MGKENHRPNQKERLARTQLMSEEYIKLKLYSKFDKMATSKGDENLSTKSSESTEVTEDNLDVSFNRATSIFDEDHLPVEDADDKIKTGFRDYVKQKGYGKGFTTLALLTANANQLHFVLTHPDAHLRTLETVFLVLSITLQVIAGVMLIIEFNLDEWRDTIMFKVCRRLDAAIMCIMFIVIVLNIFVVAFGGSGIDKFSPHSISGIDILPHNKQ